MIVKRLYLNMENWSVSRGSYQLGYIAENQVTRLQIATEIDPNCTYHLEQKINDESYILYLEKGDGVLTAIIPNTMLTSKGNANWQIVGIWADESVKKSNIFSVYISDSINAENEVPASEVTAFTEALADLAGNMSEVATYAESASTSASNASISASEASDYAENASVSAEGAATSAESASASAESASNSATNASASAEGANTSATNASISASEASTSAENAATSATNASASASEASTHASNASASATTATEQAGLASSSATSAQTYAGNASTSEQNCATYASNARVSAEEAREYVESLDNWTTVEFTLADFTYDENSGVTYLRVEAPSGYEISDIRGYITLNKNSTDSSATNICLDISTSSYSTTLQGGISTASLSTSVKGFKSTIASDVNLDLGYVESTLNYAAASSNLEWSSSTSLMTQTSTRSTPLNSSTMESTSFTLKTNVPNSNIKNFYGKLQYRVVPAS